MKALKLLILLIFFSAVSFAQTEGFIYDKETNAPIVFANIWIAGEDIGTTSDTHNLRFLSVNADGEPGQDILKHNYPVTVRKGRRTTRIDNLDTLGISMPEKGLFIAFEFLIIPDNESVITGIDTDTRKKVTATAYNPGLGNIMADSSVASWRYGAGKWYRDLGKYNKQDKKSYCLAMKVVVVE